MTLHCHRNVRPKILECPPKWSLLKEIIDEIKTDYTARKEEEAKKGSQQDKSAEKIESDRISHDGEGKKRKREKEKYKGDEDSACGVSRSEDATAPAGTEDGGRDTQSSMGAEKQDTEVTPEVEVDVEAAGRRAASRAALASLTFLRRLSGGRVVVVVKDERTTSQLRDYLIHGEVSC